MKYAALGKMTFATLSTGTWRIRLPSDWAEKEQRSDGQIYLEATDGTKGVYLATWNLGSNPKSVNEELETFRRIELRSLHAMEGRSWRVIDEWKSDGPPFAVLGLDALDEPRSYRIICQLLCDLPLIVRASFHDYDCSDYDASRHFFRPIIDSLLIHHE